MVEASGEPPLLIVCVVERIPISTGRAISVWEMQVPPLAPAPLKTGATLPLVLLATGAAYEEGVCVCVALSIHFNGSSTYQAVSGTHIEVNGERRQVYPGHAVR